MLGNMVFVSAILAIIAAEEEAEKTASAATYFNVGLHGACCCTLSHKECGH